MSLQEPMSLIETLKGRIRQHDSLLRENETRTRMALIDPLLQMLGWSVHDPDQVIGEYQLGSGWADYALLKGDGKPMAVIEAKKLGTNLASHRSQMVGYAVASGIEYAALTDGDNWEVYQVFEPVPLEDKCVLKVSISRDPASTSALRLLFLWRSNLGNGSPVQAVRPILMPDPIEPHAGWVTLATYDPEPYTSCPQAIKYWDGSSQKLGRWYEILTFIVEKLYRDGDLLESDLPVRSKATSKTCIANAEPRHPDGRPFKDSSSVAGSSIHVNTHLNAKQVRQNAKMVLARFHKGPETVMLRVAD